MLKAKYIGKTYGTGYNRDYVYLEYEYRGHTYEVYENRAKGNEPLAWQHKIAQGNIDRIIELEEKTNNTNAKPFDLDEIWDMMGWN